MVLSLGRGKLGDRLASQLGDDVAAERRNRADIGASRAASDESLCYRTMDGLSAVCPASTADNNKFRYDDGLPVAKVLLGPLDAKQRGCFHDIRDMRSRSASDATEVNSI